MVQDNSIQSVEEKFGEKVRGLRKKKHLTQEQLAVISGMHRNYISDTERGKRNISLMGISRLAESLNCNIKDFFE
jgi:transcriptional regulator with XRE-family HTH domain